MADAPAPQNKTSLDRDLKTITRVETAARIHGQAVSRMGLALLFLAGVWIFASNLGMAFNPFVVAAAVIGGYMAINIGANDVANNVGPAVGSKALTLTGAILIAAVFEAGGALLAGGDVVSTIKKGIIDPSLMPDAATFMTVMMAAILAAALWLNLATYLGAPVSTTHAIVGGVLGAGVAATGVGAVNWPTMTKIAASWVISPILGGLIAAGFLYFISSNVLNRVDKLKAAQRWVPVLVALMAGVFAMYLMNKGLKKIYTTGWAEMFVVGGATYALVWFATRARIRARSKTMENRSKSVNALFILPLIISAALLSFAHGANDVANAVGPLAAIVSASSSGEIVIKAGIPLWVMLVGAVGISIGLMLFGPRLIRTVGQEITKLNPVRAFCVALSAAITVLVASAFGLPVSSTHIAVGGVFGVGFLREYLDRRDNRRRRLSPLSAAQAGLQNALHTVQGATPELHHIPTLAHHQKSARKATKRKLVRRRHAWTIAAAWIITVPSAAALAAGLYFAMGALDIRP